MSATTVRLRRALPTGAAGLPACSARAVSRRAFGSAGCGGSDGGVGERTVAVLDRGKLLSVGGDYSLWSDGMADTLPIAGPALEPRAACWRKYSTVCVRPSLKPIFGSQPSHSLARVMSGFRWVGSSWGSGR